MVSIAAAFLKGENSRHNPRKLGRPKRRGQESESCILAKKPRKTGWSGGGPVVQMRAKRRENGGGARDNNTHWAGTENQ